MQDESDGAFETFPICGALAIIFVYIALCSFIFRFWERWDYFTAFYFFFISLTTVGLGDEMPNHPHYACGNVPFALYNCCMATKITFTNTPILGMHCGSIDAARDFFFWQQTLDVTLKTAASVRRVVCITHFCGLLSEDRLVTLPVSSPLLLEL